jgi:GT2 family glycosyltransferase
VPAVFDITGKFKVNALPSGYTPADMGRLVEMYSWRAYPRVKLLNGFCTLIHRQTVIELGLLDEMGFPQGYGEENDLCLRAAAAGHQLAIADHVYVYHAKSASFGHVRRNTLSKAGGDVLRRKHPNVDLARVQADIAESPALIRLRQDLRAHLEGNP